MRPETPCGLHTATVTGRVFCGPVALAALTGIAPAEIEQHILRHRVANPPPRRNVLKGATVRSTWSTEIEPVALTMGWRAVPCYDVPPRMSLARWWRQFGRSGAPYLVL